MLIYVLISVNPERPGDLKECFNVNLELLDDASVFTFLFGLLFTNDLFLRLKNNDRQKLTKRCYSIS